MKEKQENLHPNNALTAMLSGKRTFTAASAKDLDAVGEALAGMEEVLFPSTPTQRAEWAKNRAEMPLEEIIRYYELDTHFPRTLAFNLLQRGRHRPGSLRARRQQAGWNDDYIAQLLTRGHQEDVSASLNFDA